MSDKLYFLKEIQFCFFILLYLHFFHNLYKVNYLYTIMNFFFKTLLITIFSTLILTSCEKDEEEDIITASETTTETVDETVDETEDETVDETNTNETDNEVIGSGSYYPISVGNTWTYKNLSTNETSTHTITDSTKKINGKTFNVIEVSSKNVIDTEHIAKDGDCFYNTGTLEDNNGTVLNTFSYKALTENPVVGDSWTTEVPEVASPGIPLASGTINTSVISIHDTYTVNQVTYQDVVLVRIIDTTVYDYNVLVGDSGNPNYINTYTVTFDCYYAKNIGLIKLSIDNEFTNSQYDKILQTYSVQ